MALDIETYLQEYLVTNSAATISNIPNFIEIGIQKINKRLRGTFVETASTSPTLPSDFAAMRYLTVNGVQYNYKLQAEPGSFFVAANTLTITPALESGDLLNYVYYAINETDLTAVAPAMLIHAAAAEALMFEGNLEGANVEYGLAQALIDDGNGWDSQGTLTLGGLTTAGSVSGGTAPPPMLASNVQFTPSGTIGATNVQTAIQELDNETQAQFALTATEAYVDAAVAPKANIASPAFTGNPTAPTPAPGDNDTSIATTAFVTAADALKLNVASPAFTGTLSGPLATIAAMTGRTTTPSTGQIGELLQAEFATPFNPVSAIAANFASLVLPVGVWDLSGTLQFNNASGATMTRYEVSVGTTSAVINNKCQTMLGHAILAGLSSQLNTGLFRVVSNGSVSAYLVGRMVFSAGQPTIDYGTLFARRVA